MVLAAQSGTPLHVSYTNHLPDVYPDWIPVAPRLTHGNGNHVRPMTHLHGGFVAADSDGNPTTDNGMGYAPGETQHVYYGNGCRRCGLAALVPRPRDGHHPAGRVRRAGGRLPDPGRLRHRDRAEPDRGAGRGLRDPAGHPGPAVPPGREVPLPGQHHPGRHLDRRVLRRPHAGQREGLAVPGRRAADVPVPGAERVQRADHEPALRRAADVADRRRGRPVRRAGTVRQAVLSPAERADLLVDFRGLDGRTLELRNSTPAAPVSTPAPPLGRSCRSAWHLGHPPRPAADPGQPARPARRLHHPRQTRYISLNEIAPETAAGT